MAKDDVIEIDGNVIEALPNATFKVELDNKHVILCHIAGMMRMHNAWRPCKGGTNALQSG